MLCLNQTNQIAHIYVNQDLESNILNGEEMRKNNKPNISPEIKQSKSFIHTRTHTNAE